MRRAYGTLTDQILGLLQAERLTCSEVADRVDADLQVVSVTLSRMRKRGWIKPTDYVRMPTRRTCLRYTATQPDARR